MAALPKLKQLGITHPYMFPDPDPLPTRVVLPSLTSFDFCGISDQLEDLVAQFDAPMLLTLTLSLDGIRRVPQLLRFISRAEKLKPPIRAVFVVGQRGLVFKFMPSNDFDFTSINGKPFDQFRAMGLLCLSLSPLLSHVECLDFHCHPFVRQDRVVPAPFWLEIFRPFIAVQSLRVAKEVWRRVVYALQLLTEERATEVFPELRTLFLEEPFEDAKISIESLISARRLTVQPYTNPYPDTDC